MTIATPARPAATTAAQPAHAGSSTGRAIHVLETPLGPLALVASAAGLTQVTFEPPPPSAGGAGLRAATKHAERAARALASYFAGAEETFKGLRFATAGTPFQERVWCALRAIPFGETRSYAAIAAAIGAPRAARAIGGANHANPLAIVVPCHRVIGASGMLVGYGGGLDRKRWLLAHEGVSLPA